MADKFRTSKDTLGAKNVIRKGSKYDKASDDYAKKYPIPEYPDAERSLADTNVGLDISAAAKTAKEGGKSSEGPAIYDRLSESQRNYAKGGMVRKC